MGGVGITPEVPFWGRGRRCVCGWVGFGGGGIHTKNRGIGIQFSQNFTGEMSRGGGWFGCEAAEK